MGKFVHGLKKTRRYEIWCGMKKRCHNKNSSRYKDYGGRGIFICREWKNNFKAFYEWSGENAYNKNLLIDRIDNDKGYSPSNCRWVTNIENCNNSRVNRPITYNGKTQTLREWSWETGIKYKTIRSRINMGWKLEDVFLIPVGSIIRPTQYRDTLGRFSKPPF